MVDRGDLDISAHSASEEATQTDYDNSVQFAASTDTAPATGPAPATTPTPTVTVANKNGQSAFTVEKVTTFDPAAVKQTITAEVGKPIELPADAQIDAILVSGNDLIIRESNGDLILIKDGLKHVPVLHIGSIEIPAEALTASLTANGVTLPAAGGDNGEIGRASCRERV